MLVHRKAEHRRRRGTPHHSFRVESFRLLSFCEEPMNLSRRQFHTVAGATAAALCESTSWAMATGELETFVPTRQITSGPMHHWFGYYDKREFDPTGTR